MNKYLYVTVNVNFTYIQLYYLGLKWKAFKWYKIKKQVEPFCISSLDDTTFNDSLRIISVVKVKRSKNYWKMHWISLYLWAICSIMPDKI